MTDMTINEQLEKWVNGQPIHNTSCDECCPDFSCCNPSLLAEESVRKRFAQAVAEGDERLKHEMLGMFLGAALSAAGKGTQVHIAGDEPGGTQ